MYNITHTYVYAYTYRLCGVMLAQLCMAFMAAQICVCVCVCVQMTKYSLTTFSYIATYLIRSLSNFWSSSLTYLVIVFDIDTDCLVHVVMSDHHPFPTVKFITS